MTLDDRLATILSDLRDCLREEIRTEILEKLTPTPVVRPAPVPAARVGIIRAVKVRRAKSGSKRSPEELAEAVTHVLGVIEKNPGIGAEGISEKLTLGTPQITLPIAKLLAAKAITKRGQKRATRYYPASAKKNGKGA